MSDDTIEQQPITLTCADCNYVEEHADWHALDMAYDAEEGQSRFSEGRQAYEDGRFLRLCNTCGEKRYAQWYLNVYNVSRHFGGAEEGGWWYDVGTPVASVPLSHYCEYGDPELIITKERIESAMNITFDTRYRFSMRPDGPDYMTRVEPHMAEAWPASTPYYC
jgi:hypothetical protein